MRNQYYIGLMSGTSLDGVDAVLLALGEHATGSKSSTVSVSYQVCGHVYQPFDAPLRADCLALQQAGPNELHLSRLLANQLSEVYAHAVASLLAKQQLPSSAILALGAHGQTVRHQPHLGYSIQLLNPALLAELSGIDVTCDFRSRDIAAGGQGAPLVPAFHHAYFQHASESRVILNIGGFANLTWLPAAADLNAVQGFDCGPGNVLLDSWCQLHHQSPFDESGAWAAAGTVIPALLERLCSDPYFALPFPKSTGRDYFHLQWLNDHCQQVLGAGPYSQRQTRDIQATLLALTAQTVASAIREVSQQRCQRVIVCGGGALNRTLLAAIQGYFEVPVVTSDEYGLAPMWVEAAAFAWLAYAFCRRMPANLPTVTGARDLRVLGALYPSH